MSTGFPKTALSNFNEIVLVEYLLPLSLGCYQTLEMATTIFTVGYDPTYDHKLCIWSSIIILHFD